MSEMTLKTTPAEDPVGLNAPVTRLRSIGARSATRLAKLGIQTVRQLLWHIPSRYEDYSQAVPIADVIPGEKMSIKGHILNISNRHIWPRRLTITTATVQDESGAIRAVWFNQPYLAEALAEGTLVSMAGKIVLDKRGIYINSPVYEKVLPVESADLRHTGRLVPVYPETEGVTSKYLRYLIQPLLEELKWEDPVPAQIRSTYALLDLDAAVRTIHYPDTVDQVPLAKERLAFDDLLLFQLKALHDRRQLNKLRSPRVTMDNVYMKELVASLPFTLTKDQRVAAVEVLRDMEKAYPMNRLLEGDVGSGKTVVALLAALHAARQGLQTVVLAPTEVLALQHYTTLARIAAGAGIHTALLTGASARIDQGEATKAAVKKAIAGRVAMIIIGTHAVLEEDVRWAGLALVVIDEQHRFGIAQRSALVKADRHSDGRVPHLLSMTATPIPRTLALTIFGDLDISIIREKPKGRQPIQTKVISTLERTRMNDLIREEVRKGQQVFVICPRIEVTSTDVQAKSDAVPPKSGKLRQTKLNPLWADIKAVEEEYERLSKKVFPGLKVAMLHGRMKPKEKQNIMQEFKDGWHDILVSTSVIEVGVDVPNATIMVIEGADRFGLAQLHQFRGRVGRGERQSYCFLVPSDEGAAKARLAVLEKTDDGFMLAEADMKLRGPGEFFGIKQSGMPDLTMTALANVDLIKKARTAARVIMKKDPDLKKYPLLREQLESFRKLSHFE
jgi:ATP-dependent DNA helicase RecG